MLNLLKRNRNTRTNSSAKSLVEDGFDLPALFDDFVSRDLFAPAFGTTGVTTPAVNIIETPDEFYLEMAAPGMKKSDFKIEVENDVLTVSYDHEDNREGERKNWKYRTHEFNYHSFSRSFSLAETVEAEKIKAKYDNGILNVVIPKKEESKSKPAKQIQIV
jgi:HSP20 family protein